MNTPELPKGKFSTVEMNGLGNIKSILYSGDLETCKYMADKHAAKVRKIMVVNSDGQPQYAAN